MQSGPQDPIDGNEQLATAFVFGELSRDEAMEFMKAMNMSAELRATVNAIREAVGAVKAELETGAVGVNLADRRRIEAAIRDPRPEPPPVVAIGSDGASRQWAVGLAVAATLLLATGLTLPALNRVISANSINQDFRERLQQVELDNQRLRAQKQTLIAELARLGTDTDRVLGSEAMEPVAGNPERIATNMDSGSASSGYVSDDDRSRSADVHGVPIGRPDTVIPADTVIPDTVIPDTVIPDTLTADAMVRDVATSTTEAEDHEDSVANDGPHRLPRARAAESFDGATGGSASGASKTRFDPTALASEAVQDDLPEMPDSEVVAKDFSRLAVLGQLIPGRIRRLILPPVDADPKNVELDSDAEGMGGIALGGGKKNGSTSIRSALTRLSEFERALEQTLPHSLDVTGGIPMIPVIDNPFLATATTPLSTFQIDSLDETYAELRTSVLQHGQLPSPDAVRIEDMINWFPYRYAPPADDQTIACAIQIAKCPWNTDHRLARVGIQGRTTDRQRSPCNLVFLLDVSGSMNRPNKLPLVIEQLKSLVRGLDHDDTIAIVAYASAGGMVLDATTGDRKKIMIDAIDRVRSGGPTNAGRGIQLAYDIAARHSIKDGINRIIVCSDDDFSFGAASTDELIHLAEQHSSGNLSLTVLGFGADNRIDPVIEELNRRGIGTYAYVENQDQARLAIVDQFLGTPATIAKDVRIQVEFNPTEVDAYRLIGYENWNQEMADPLEDASLPSDLVEGQSITALYEIVPRRGSDSGDAVVTESLMGPLKYQQHFAPNTQSGNGEMLSLKLNYQDPQEQARVLVEFSAKDSQVGWESADRDFQFAAAVAAFGMMLRNSPHKGEMEFAMIETLASAGAIEDRSGYREEFVTMIRQARKIGGW